MSERKDRIEDMKLTEYERDWRNR